MKVTVLQTDLSKWLSVAGRIVPTRGQLPVLANVLLVADKNGLTISATNLEIGLSLDCGGKMTEAGAITVPAKNLSELVSSLPVGNVELTTDGEKLEVKEGKLGAVFTGIPAGEFPAMQKPGEENKKSGKSFKLSKNIISSIATQVAFAAATDESRPVLTGVKLEIIDKELIIIATDGFRLSKKSVKLEEKIEILEKTLILPARTVSEIARIINEGKKETVEMTMGGENNQVFVEYENILLASRILEGNFPDVEKIIPKSDKTKIIVDREEIVHAIKAMGIFARESSNVVKFKIEGSSLKIEASSSQTGEGSMEIDTEKKGEDNQIAFNYRYVLDFLNSADEERVTLAINESLTPGVWGLEKDNSLQHVIMPVRI
jgi:DNA polymerase III subunit beta